MAMTKEEMRAREQRYLWLKAALKPGDYVMHKRCLGYVEEHIFTGWDGPWICGKATGDTQRVNGTDRSANDIAPSNVTHINRRPIGN